MFVKSADETVLRTDALEKLSGKSIQAGKIIEIKDKKLFCISRLKKYTEDYSIIPSKGINEIEIDNLKGFKLVAKNNADKTEEMYQVILFDNDGGYYLFVGTCIKENEKALADIKKIIKTFTRKK